MKHTSIFYSDLWIIQASKQAVPIPKSLESSPTLCLKMIRISEANWTNFSSQSLLVSNSIGYHLCQLLSTFHLNLHFNISVKGLFITSVTGISALISFSYAFASTRKQNSSSLDSVSAQVYDSGTQLAFRALKWGTFYAFTGVGLFMFGIWKVANVNNVSNKYYEI